MFEALTSGNAIALGGFVISGVGVVYAVRRDVAVLASRLGPIESAVVRLTDIMEKLARQDERLKSVEREIERDHLREQWREASPR